jgi:rod shape-determining protein MreD
MSSEEEQQGGWIIFLSFCVGFILAIMPLPEWIVIWRPDWISMILIYWCIAIPQRVSIGSGWIVGIVADVLNDTLLGQHALSLSIVAYLSVRFHRQVRIFPWWQQSATVVAIIAISQLPIIWVRGMLGYPQIGWIIFYPALTSILFWHWLFVILRDLRRTYQVG